jgi:hypothetical protein
MEYTMRPEERLAPRTKGQVVERRSAPRSAGISAGRYAGFQPAGFRRERAGKMPA